MTRTFIQTDEFSRNWDEFGFTDDDLRRLEFDIYYDEPSQISSYAGYRWAQKGKICI